MDSTDPMIHTNPLEATFSTLALSFPLPFRVLTVICLGVWAWALNIHGLTLLGIDSGSMLSTGSRLNGYNGRDDDDLAYQGGVNLIRPGRSATPYLPIYKLAGFFSAWIYFSWLVWHRLVRLGFAWNEAAARQNTGSAAEKALWLQVIAFLVPLTVLVTPISLFYRKERSAFLKALRRCASLHPKSLLAHVSFADVILTDILTSFAKVIGDIVVVLVAFLGASKAPIGADILNGDLVGGYLVPCTTALPYLFRLRQCIAAYVTSSDSMQASAKDSILRQITSHPQSREKRHLWNALKYSTAFPVIVLSALQRRTMAIEVEASEDAGSTMSPFMGIAWLNEGTLFHLWLLTALVNSLYSFWWDVTYDWGLGMFEKVPWNREIIVSRADLLARDSDGVEEHVLHLGPNGISSVSDNIEISPVPHDEAHLTKARRRSLSSFHGSRSSVSLGSERSTLPWLRSQLTFDGKVYYIAIALDLVLRLTWSLKLSSHLHVVSEIEMGIFILEILEVVRRWIWVYLRVEWETIRTRPSTKRRSEVIPL